MRNKRFTIVLLILMDMAFGCLYLSSSAAMMLHPPTTATGSTEIHRMLSLRPGGSVSCAIPPPQGKRKGIVTGWWFCRPAPAGIECRVRAADDTIARLYDHARSGGFSLRFSGDGGFRFAFSDDGHSLPVECQVEIIAAYQPE